MIIKGLIVVVALLQLASATQVKRQVILIPQPYQSQLVDDSVCHPEPTADAPQHIIGYGSFIKDEHKTGFYAGAGDSIPVRVRGLSRHWNFQNRTFGFGLTDLGTALNAAGTINAVAFTIPPGDNLTATLLEHDDRQKQYCRQRVPVKSITTFINKESNALEDGDYWTYVTRSEFANSPNPNYPIVQSFVDEFISGCLEVGKKFDIPSFADECVESTYGWETNWVNDRIYPRRPEVKQPYAQEIDTVLARKAPLAFSRITIE